MISESWIKRAAKNHAFGFETFFALLSEPSELRFKRGTIALTDFGCNRSKTLLFTTSNFFITYYLNLSNLPMALNFLFRFSAVKVERQLSKL